MQKQRHTPGKAQAIERAGMRVRGQKGCNDATSIMFISALHQRIDFDRYLDQGTTVKLFIDEELDAVCENDEDVYLYYVKSGALEVGMNRDAERNTIFFIRSEGDAVICSRQGYLSFGTNRFTLKAVRNTVLVGFTLKQVKELIRSDDDFLEDYLYEMHMAMAQMGHRIDTTAHQSSSRRILLWLDKLCEANEPDADGAYRIPCNLTVDELAGLLLIHYATCNKLLKALKERNIVNKTRTHLEIADRAQIKELLRDENPVLY